MRSIALFICLVLLWIAPAATVADDHYAGQAYYVGEDFFTAEELEDLLAPIALYPDPLIAQILPAATFADQIRKAARYVRRHGRSAGIDRQPWDVSVKAIAHYPTVLFMMDEKYDWTIALGQAFVDQEDEVMDTIQQLRADARTAGSLFSTPQQQVLVEEELISIIPAQAEVIYVPRYDPVTVYVEGAYPSYGLLSFGVGFGIGAWLNRDCDWHRHRIYYHGWRGRGWINRARPHVNIRNRTYIDRRHQDIRINRRVVQHDTIQFRSRLRRDAEQRRERIGRPSGLPSAPGRRRNAPPHSGVGPAAPGPGSVERGTPVRRQPGVGTSPGTSADDLKARRQGGRMSRDTLHQRNKQPLSSGEPARVPERTQPTAPSPAMEQAPSNQPPATRPAPQTDESRPTRQR